MANLQPEIHIGDEGTDLRFTVQDENEAIVDISGNTVLEVIFRKPDGSALVKTATLFTDGTDGIARYTATDIWDQTGQWDAQLRLAIPGWSGRSSSVSFRVYEALSLI